MHGTVKKCERSIMLSHHFTVILIPFGKLQYSTCQVGCNHTFYTFYGSVQFNNSYSAKSTKNKVILSPGKVAFIFLKTYRIFLLTTSESKSWAKNVRASVFRIRRNFFPRRQFSFHKATVSFSILVTARQWINNQTSLQGCKVSWEKGNWHQPGRESFVLHH